MRNCLSTLEQLLVHIRKYDQFVTTWFDLFNKIVYNKPKSSADIDSYIKASPGQEPGQWVEAWRKVIKRLSVLQMASSSHQARSFICKMEWAFNLDVANKIILAPTNDQTFNDWFWVLIKKLQQNSRICFILSHCCSSVSF